MTAALAILALMMPAQCYDVERAAQRWLQGYPYGCTWDGNYGTCRSVLGTFHAIVHVVDDNTVEVQWREQCTSSRPVCGAFRRWFDLHCSCYSEEIKCEVL